MAGAIFNAIVPSSKKDRIVVNYGGIIKNQAWAKVDATYMGLLEINNNSPKIKLTNYDKFSLSEEDVTNKEITINANISTSLNFNAEGPESFSNNQQVNKTNYMWKLDNGSWTEKGLNDNFEVSNLSEGQHTVYVKAYDKNNTISSTEAKVTINVKKKKENKKVKRILCGLGWSNWTKNKYQLSLGVEFYDKNDKRINEVKIVEGGTTDYGMLTVSTNSKNKSTQFYDRWLGISNISPQFVIKNVIRIVENSDLGEKQLQNIKAAEVNKIKFYVEKNKRNNAIKFKEIYGEETNYDIYVDLFIVYENDYVRKQIKEIGKDSNDYKVYIATLKADDDQEWIIEDSE